MSMPEDRYPKQLYSQEWNIKPCRGRLRKTLCRVVGDLFVARVSACRKFRRESSAASFIASIEERIGDMISVSIASSV